MMLKTFSRDFAYAKRLVDSYRNFRINDIPLCIVCPHAELKIFEALKGGGVVLLPEEEIPADFVKEGGGESRRGYLNQQIAKLTFWKTGIARNYLCLDSEAYFIRPFSYDDFIQDDGVPFTFLSDDRELLSDPRYFRRYWVPRAQALEAIKREIGLEGAGLSTTHHLQTFSSHVLLRMEEDLLAPRNLSYRDLVEQQPYEFSWYNFWLQKSEAIPIVRRDPIFKTFHHKGQYLASLRSGIRAADLKRAFVGVLINSNFSRRYGVISYGDPLEHTSLSRKMREVSRQASRWLSHMQKSGPE